MNRVQKEQPSDKFLPTEVCMTRNRFSRPLPCCERLSKSMSYHSDGQIFQPGRDSERSERIQQKRRSADNKQTSALCHTPLWNLKECSRLAPIMANISPSAYSLFISESLSMARYASGLILLFGCADMAIFLMAYSFASFHFQNF